MCRFMRIYTQSYRIILRFLSQSYFSLNGKQRMETIGN